MIKADADYTYLLSIIVPAFNEAETITSTLQPLQLLRNKGCEIILADGGSDDATTEQAAPFIDQYVNAEKGRAKQMNAGAGIARGRWLLFLHADTLLPANFSTFLMSLATTQKQWGFFSLTLTGRDIFFRLIEAAINVRSKLSSIATGDQCLFVQRSVFQHIGGFADIALMEDIHLCKTLRKLSSPQVCDDKVLTSSRRWQRHGIVKTVLLMWYLRLAYFFGVSPDYLAKVYYGR